MEFLILMLIFMFIVVGRHAAKAAESTKGELNKIIEKKCPPHKWRYHEVKDHEGNVHAWKLICDHCGPLKPLDQPERMDY